MPVDELNGPVAFAWWVLPLGLALLLLAVGWVVAVLVTTRRRAEPGPPPPPPAVHARPGDRFATVRPLYLARVDEVERRFDAGELDARGVHLELSAVVRDFATIRRGVDARVLTLSELRRIDGAKRLATLIESYYRPSFARFGTVGASTENALQGARRVISQW